MLYSSLSIYSVFTPDGLDCVSMKWRAITAMPYSPGCGMRHSYQTSTVLPPLGPPRSSSTKHIRDMSRWSWLCRAPRGWYRDRCCPPQRATALRAAPTPCPRAQSAPAASCVRQGLTLVHFRLNVSAFYGIGAAWMGCLRGVWEVFEGHQGTCRVYFVSESTQVDLKNGRV
jgi:hypothetical protein